MPFEDSSEDTGAFGAISATNPPIAVRPTAARPAVARPTPARVVASPVAPVSTNGNGRTVTSTVNNQNGFGNGFTNGATVAVNDNELSQFDSTSGGSNFESASFTSNSGASDFGSNGRTNGAVSGSANGFASSSSSGKSEDADWKTLRQESDISEDGYHW